MRSYRSIPLCIGGGPDPLVSQLASMTLFTLAMARATLTIQRHYGYPPTLWDLKGTQCTMGSQRLDGNPKALWNSF